MRKEFTTYTATISLGLRLGYGPGYWSPDIARSVVRDYVKQHKFGVTITDTEFVYDGGSEPGLLIGMINYPRFPSTKYQIRRRALALAEALKSELQQVRVTVVFPDKTVMLETVGVRK